MKLLDKMIWINDKIPYMFHNNILEYDMNAASLSLADRYKLLPQNTIDMLKRLPKKDRVVKTGYIRRDNKEFSVTVDKKLREVRQQFIEENEIDDDSLLSVHSDAIIFASRREIKDNIDGIQFKRSGQSVAYLNYNRVEIFYDGTGITYKGIPEEMQKQHTMGMTRYLNKVFRYIDDYDVKLMDYLAKFQKNYIQDQYPEYFYHPFCKLGGKFKVSNLEFLAFIANIAVEEIKRW